MLTFTRDRDGQPVHIAAHHVVSVMPDIPDSDRTEICAGGYSYTVRESPAEVARLVAEAQRPASAVDLEAVALARRLLTRLAEACDSDPSDVDELGYVIDATLDSHAMRWWHSAAALRALAARLGGTP